MSLQEEETRTQTHTARKTMWEETEKRVEECMGERGREHTHAGEKERESALTPPVICFFLYLGLPYANWA